MNILDSINHLQPQKLLNSLKMKEKYTEIIVQGQNARLRSCPYQIE